MVVLRIKRLNRARACIGMDVPSSSMSGEDKETDGYSDFTEEEREAASILCMMKHARVDEETLAKLRRTVKRTCSSESKIVSGENGKDHEEEGDSDVREYLEAMMGERSEPFKKKLTGSDVNDIQARLNMTKESMVKHILPLLRPGENIHAGLPVTTYNSDGVGFPMTFKVWCQKSNVLTRGWIKFVHANDLRVNQCITVQAFRHADTNELSFLVLPSKE